MVPVQWEGDMIERKKSIRADWAPVVVVAVYAAALSFMFTTLICMAMGVA
jgi:hypothetical protein